LISDSGSQFESLEVEVRDQSGYLSAQETSRRAVSLGERLRSLRVRRMAVRVSSGSDLVVTLLACRPLGVEPVIVSPWLPEEVADSVSPDCWVRLGHDGSAIAERTRHPRVLPAEPDTHASGVVVFSSGTTGVPKATRWEWEALSRHGAGETWKERWGIGYMPFTFAGLSATCEALGRARVLEYIEPTDLAITSRHGSPLDVAAGTPSFWRMSVIAVGRANARPRPVGVATVGGEPVDEALLGLLRSFFAPTRIKQIFGTTEFGVLVSIDDERPGLPCSLIGKRLPNGVAFDIEKGMLRFSASAGAPFRETGDTVRIISGRVHVTARAGGFINVGGFKVDPVFVSQTISRHPDVIGVRAYPVPNVLLGNVIGIDVVPRLALDPARLAVDIKSYASRHLAPAERPRRVRITDQLLLAPSGKLSLDG
jgi:acyl-CoA synthetase (AMP-forming)/AMP-acid ligase II